MKRNNNKILKAIFLAIALSVQLVHAEDSDTKLMGGAGIGFLAKLSSPQFILETLEREPEATPNYFNKNPLNFNPIANILIPKLKTATTEEEYARLYRVAELMGLEPIPPYKGKKSNATIYTNPQQDLNRNDTKYSNPQMEEEAGGNIITTPQGKKIDTSTEFPYEQPKNWAEYLLLKSNSQKLADNIDKEMKLNNPNWVRPANVAAHHIIPATHPFAQDARLILEKYKSILGTDPFNNELNGVYLPTPNSTNNQGIIHNGKHPDDYVKTINQIIVDADRLGGLPQVMLELQKAKNILQNAQPGTDWRKVL